MAKGKASLGGVYKDGWIKASTRSFGTFSVEIDTIAPQVTPIAQNSWRVNRNIRFKVSDGQTGIQKYKVNVDGKFILFALKHGMLVIQDPERTKKGVSHVVEVVVADGCGNITKKQYKM